MRERYADAEIVSDVGSGINFKRRGLLAILDQQYTQEISSVLSSPTETVLRGLGRNSFRPCSNPTGENSWFSIGGSSAPKRNLRLTFSPSSLSSALGSTACGDTVRNSMKIPLYPGAR